MGPGFESLEVHQVFNAYFLFCDIRINSQYEQQALKGQLGVKLNLLALVVLIACPISSLRPIPQAVCSGSRVRVSSCIVVMRCRQACSYNSLLCWLRFDKRILNHFILAHRCRCTIYSSIAQSVERMTVKGLPCSCDNAVVQAAVLIRWYSHGLTPNTASGMH